MTALLAHLMQAAGQGTVYVSDENARGWPLERYNLSQGPLKPYIKNKFLTMTENLDCFNRGKMHTIALTLAYSSLISGLYDRGEFCYYARSKRVKYVSVAESGHQVLEPCKKGFLVRCFTLNREGIVVGPKFEGKNLIWTGMLPHLDVQSLPGPEAEIDLTLEGNSEGFFPGSEEEVEEDE